MRRDHAQRLLGIDALWPDGAQMQPAVAEVELVHELLAAFQATQLRPSIVEERVWIVVISSGSPARKPSASQN